MIKVEVIFADVKEEVDGADGEYVALKKKINDVIGKLYKAGNRVIDVKIAPIEDYNACCIVLIVYEEVAPEIERIKDIADVLGW